MTAVDLLRRQLQEAYDRLRTRVEGLTDDEFLGALRDLYRLRKART